MPDTPGKPKFEREIDQNIAESEKKSGRQKDFVPFSPTVEKSKNPIRKRSISLNSGTAIFAGIVFLVGAAVLPAMQMPLAILGIASIGLGYYLWFNRGRQPQMNWRGRSTERQEPPAKYWRGRRIEPKQDRQEKKPKDRAKILDFGDPDDK